MNIITRSCWEKGCIDKAKLSIKREYLMRLEYAGGVAYTELLSFNLGYQVMGPRCVTDYDLISNSESNNERKGNGKT